MNQTHTVNPMFEMIGYTPKTTFWSDFSIAECFGVKGIKDTYNRAKNEWEDNIEYMTEFAMVLNHKSWYYNEKNQEFCTLYSELWEEADNFIYEQFKDDEKALQYYMEVTD